MEHPTNKDAAVAAGDFRTFLRQLEDEKDLLQIDCKVDPHLEIAAIVRKVYETEDKAPLFNNIRGRTQGELFRILGAPVGASRLDGKRFIRIAKSLGLPSGANGATIIDKILQAKSLPEIPPKEVATGPIKQHVIVGDGIDLTQLPIPYLHVGDGGKYLQTCGMYIVETPDRSWVNWSITRSMVVGKRSMTGPVIPKQDIGVIRELWKSQGQDMPFALCFGVPPAALMASGMPLPKGKNEANFIGAMLGEPVEVTKAETNSILVPANAEIVIEGSVSLTDTAMEGPMAEYHGMMFPSSSKPCPVFNVDAITYRDDPILPICVAGRATEENHTIWGLMQAAEVLSLCQAAGLPIKMVWNPFESVDLWFVLQVDRRKLREAKTNISSFSLQIGHIVFGSKPGYYIPKLYIVGEDIDPTNLKDVIWAEATRCQPKANEFFFDEYSNIPLIPYVSHGIRPGQMKNHFKVVRCCMFPAEFESEPFWTEASFRGSYPSSIRTKVHERWEEYGFS